MNRRRWLAAALLAVGCGDASPAVATPATAIVAPQLPPAATGTAEPARCAACHPDHVSRWQASGHAVATRPADPSLLPWTPPAHAREGLGPNPVDVTLRDGTLWCAATTVDGQPARYALTHIVGGRDRQRYLTALAPDGRAWGLPLEFDLRTGAWRPFWAPDVARQPTPMPSGDPRYWHGRQENFSAICFRCHTPLTRFSYDAESGRYTVDWGRPDELGVQCTACHGDARAHATAAEHARTQPAIVVPPPPVAPRPRPDAVTEVGSCGRCHFTGEVLHPDYRPGDDYFDAHSPIVFDDTARFWPDGLRKQEAYTLVEHHLSTCFRSGGLRCQDCHDPHGEPDRAATRTASRAACARCHDTLPSSCTAHDTVAAPERPDCLHCHLPRIPTAGSARTMHDHRVLAPDPLLTAQIGIPNACADCHRDRSPEWASTQLARWGARPRPRRRWALALDAGLRGDPAAPAALVALLSDPATPWPIGATAARLLGRYPSPAHRDALAQAVAHGAHAMVRSGAAYGLVGQPGPEAVAALRGALDDPVRAARLMIATALIVRDDPDTRSAALAEIDAVLAAIPDDVALRRLRAYALERAGQPHDALAEYARARRCAPYDQALADAEARCRQAVARDR